MMSCCVDREKPQFLGGKHHHCQCSFEPVKFKTLEHLISPTYRTCAGDTRGLVARPIVNGSEK